MENNIEIRPLQRISNMVHIGDGIQLKYGFDYLWDDDYVYIIDPKRLARRIGAIKSDGYDEKVMNRWIRSISNNSIDLFIEDKNLDLSTISQRVITNWYGEFAKTNFINTQIHDVFGRPYIPGSSIKGALRTAIIATLARRRVTTKTRLNEVEDLEMRLASGTTDKKSSVRSDFFRFIRATDAFYEQGCEVVINVPRMTAEKMNDIKVILEAIAPNEDENTSFLLNIDVDQYNLVKDSGLMDSIGIMPDEIKTINGLLHLVNEHTLFLVNEEIKAWKLIKSYNAEKYVETLQLLKQECLDCGQGECILRLGMGSGKIFITGGWAMKLPGVSAPKTRAVYNEDDDHLNVLGFIKLAHI